MRTKLIIAVLLLAIVLPQPGCNVRKKYRAEKAERIKLARESDSIATRYRDSLAALVAVRRTVSALESSTMLRANNESEVNITTEKAKAPVTVSGESFTSSITANWVLDSTAVTKGNLVYFDMDNPTLRAKIYKDSSSGQMMISIKTKDKVVDVPVDKVSFSSKKTVTTDSSTTARQLNAAMDSLGQFAATSTKDSVSTIDRLQFDKYEKSKTASSTKTDFFKLWWLWLIGAIVLAVWIIRMVYGGGWINSILNKVKKAFK